MSHSPQEPNIEPFKSNRHQPCSRDDFEGRGAVGSSSDDETLVNDSDSEDDFQPCSEDDFKGRGAISSSYRDRTMISSSEQ